MKASVQRITPRLQEVLDRFHAENPRQFLTSTLQAHGGSISEAAKSIGVARLTLISWMSKYGVRITVNVEGGE